MVRRKYIFLPPVLSDTQLCLLALSVEMRLLPHQVELVRNCQGLVVQGGRRRKQEQFLQGELGTLWGAGRLGSTISGASLQLWKPWK
jgi:hypothetical protein